MKLTKRDRLAAKVERAWKKLDALNDQIFKLMSQRADAEIQVDMAQTTLRQYENKSGGR